MTLRIVADEGREPSPYFATAVALARSSAETTALDAKACGTQREQYEKRPDGESPQPPLTSGATVNEGTGINPTSQPAPGAVLHVVEFLFEGTWRPLCGDAYLDEGEASRCSAESSLETRVRRYVPEREP